MSEIILLNEKQNNIQNENIIKYIHENKIVEKIILLIKHNNKEINLKIIKYLSILISNSSNVILTENKNNDNFFNYICQNEYINQIILNLNDNNEEKDDDYLSYYINFLKTITNKINIDSLRLIFHFEYNTFPLLDQILILLNHDDIMIRNSARNIFLSLIKINYMPLIEYLCDIPRISIFIISIQKIKGYLLLIFNLKNNNSKFYFEKTKELNEKMIEDLLFIQDILSINILKINYILINCLFSILFVYLFGKIISFSKNLGDGSLKNELSKSTKILQNILKNIKNEIIKNIICFLLFSDKVYVKINKFLLNEDIIDNNKNYKKENLRLLNLNNINFNYNYSKIEFEDFLIINYSQNFFKAIKYDHNNYKMYNEINELYNYIKGDNQNDEIKAYIQILNDKYFKNNNNFIIKMYNYHYFISKTTGINCGTCSNGEEESFCLFLYNNFLIIQSDFINNFILFNNYYENNILKKAFLIILKNITFNDNDIHLFLNIIVLFIEIINDSKISLKLLEIMNINKSMEKENNIININELSNENYQIDEIMKNKLMNIKYPEKIPEPINKIDNNDININENEYMNNFLHISINNKKIFYKDFNFNNDFFSKINYDINMSNNNNEIIITIINFIFSPKFNLNNIHILLCFNLIEHLIFEDNQKDNNKKIYDLIQFHYLETLRHIKEILFKNNSDSKNEIFKYSYSLFENCFNLNKKCIKELINDYITDLQSSSYIILEKSQNFEEKVKLKYFFQKFISLHDLKIRLCQTNKNNNLLFRNIAFPLDLIKNELFNIGGKINLKEYQIKPIEVNFIKNFSEKSYYYIDEIQEQLVMFIYNNFLFFALSPERVFSYDINALDDQDNSFIKYKYSLRNITFSENPKNNELLLSFIDNNATKFKILLIFKDVNLFNEAKNLIIKGINYASILEYSSLTCFINNFIGEAYKNNESK